MSSVQATPSMSSNSDSTSWDDASQWTWRNGGTCSTAQGTHTQHFETIVAHWKVQLMIILMVRATKVRSGFADMATSEEEA